MQVLDKVTAETLQFEAPIGRAIRYKTLVMTVRVCETRGAQDPQPRPSAYVMMETRAPAVSGREPPPPKQVFEGWMFANAPSTHPLEHPIYDAWLVSCSSLAPVARPPAPAPVTAKSPMAKPSAVPALVPGAAKKAPTTKVPVATPLTPPPSAPASGPDAAPPDTSTTPPQ